LCGYGGAPPPFPFCGVKKKKTQQEKKAGREKKTTPPPPPAPPPFSSRSRSTTEIVERLPLKTNSTYLMFHNDNK